MIDGITASGTHHAGLKVMHHNGTLSAVYNLGLLAERNQAAVESFRELVDALIDLLPP